MFLCHFSSLYSTLNPSVCMMLMMLLCFMGTGQNGWKNVKNSIKIKRLTCIFIRKQTHSLSVFTTVDLAGPRRESMMRIQGLKETKKKTNQTLPSAGVVSAEQRRHPQVKQRRCVNSLFADVVFGGHSGGVGAESVVSQRPVLTAVILETKRSRLSTISSFYSGFHHVPHSLTVSGY